MAEPNNPRQIPSPRAAIKALLDNLAMTLVDTCLSIYDERRSPAGERVKLSPAAAEQASKIDDLIESYGRAAYHAGTKHDALIDDPVWIKACEAKVAAENVLTAAVEALLADRDAALTKAKHLESLRPIWAQGYTSDSVAAQMTSAALTEIWRALGVENQTDAMAKLRQAPPVWNKAVVWRYELRVGQAEGVTSWRHHTSLVRPRDDDPKVRDIVGLCRNPLPREVLQWATEQINAWPVGWRPGGEFAEDFHALRSALDRILPPAPPHRPAVYSNCSAVHGCESPQSCAEAGACVAPKVTP